jgi:hypothetical protein
MEVGLDKQIQFNQTMASKAVQMDISMEDTHCVSGLFGPRCTSQIKAGQFPHIRGGLGCDLDAPQLAACYVRFI